MEIFIGSDYLGLKLKTALLDFLRNQGFNLTDEGAYEYIEGDDYNDPAIKVAKKLRETPNSKGILICDSAHGMTIQANRYKGIRAVNCNNELSAKLAREHDDANVLCLPAHFLTPEAATKIATTFLTTDFTPLERRVRRINRLDEREDYA